MRALVHIFFIAEAQLIADSVLRTESILPLLERKQKHEDESFRQPLLGGSHQAHMLSSQQRNRLQSELETMLAPLLQQYGLAPSDNTTRAPFALAARDNFLALQQVVSTTTVAPSSSTSSTLISTTEINSTTSTEPITLEFDVSTALTPASITTAPLTSAQIALARSFVPTVDSILSLSTMTPTQALSYSQILLIQERLERQIQDIQEWISNLQTLTSPTNSPLGVSDTATSTTQNTASSTTLRSTDTTMATLSSLTPDEQLELLQRLQNQRYSLLDLITQIGNYLGADYRTIIQFPQFQANVMELLRQTQDAWENIALDLFAPVSTTNRPQPSSTTSTSTTAPLVLTAAPVNATDGSQNLIYLQSPQAGIMSRAISIATSARSARMGATSTGSSTPSPSPSPTATWEKSSTPMPSIGAVPCLDLTHTWLSSALSNMSKIRIMVDQEPLAASIRYTDLRPGALPLATKNRMVEELEEAIEICTNLSRQSFEVSVDNTSPELTLLTSSISGEILDGVISVLTFSE